MKKTIVLLVASLLFIFTAQVQAGVVLGGTRVIYKDNVKESSLRVSNSDNSPVLVQSWIETTQGTNDKSPFIITPPLFKLNGKQENTLRIIKLQNTLPQDRESLFWLNVKGIPSTENDSKNKLVIAIKNQIKLIYRPKALLDGSSIEASKKLKWHREGNVIKATNDSPYYINFNYVKVNGNELEMETINVLPPYSTHNYDLPTTSAKNKMTGTILSWQAINDYGGVEEVNSVNL
ncbi:MAG: molecular chaperone [Rouxiella aceris]|uniref:fimbrial biogenesis chaperone n=1 Tax=Rouxiella aceris TaxID=2703884 RepID=UPI00284FA480|nr:molecular chaperone [Rouxiella aceris]MDR3430793.1 molecular chaperone [Rouxiella aceris]